MLLDANILLYAVDEESPVHEASRTWMEGALNGPSRVGIPWMSITAFLRIVTNARALREPLTAAEAWGIVESWLDAPSVWVPAPGPGHREIFGRLVRSLDLRANLVPDAVLAALCVEHGLQMISADTDFARFTEIAWHNPVAL
ncbi:MAG: PIN domain-containing protein [Actinomycetota bacterium]|nr:PIN domain-containing protein [Actinomycetota bacterium]